MSKPPKMPKVSKVKDKSPAEMQITAEQLLREAKERELEIVPPPPKQKIADPEELREYRLKKRREFEDNIRKNRGNVGNWIKYGKWEEEQQEIRRARSVYERSLDVEHRCITLWLKYAEMEMKNKQVNHARNIWDRAVTILPRVSQFWYKYTHMEEVLSNVAGAREVFERWMKWEPDEQAWQTYINFELRCKEIDRARKLYERFVHVHPEPKNWVKYCRFEESRGYIRSCRQVYERAVVFFGDTHMDESLLIAFARFEEGQKEHDRARTIFKYGLDHLDDCKKLRNEYTKHEKKYGDRSAIDDVIMNKRRLQYKAALDENNLDYDTWFDYIRMMESEGQVEQIRDVYEQAIACVPPVKEKKHWRRYIYLWIYYAIYEEKEAKDFDRARDVYKMCLKLIPHKLFTFAKIWLLYAKFEIRQKDLVAARKTLGQAIGHCPKNKLFRGYIDIEIKLREFDRCRKLYEKWLLFDPENCKCWIQFATLEMVLGDFRRCRAIYELAVQQPRLDMPEYLWKAYIDSEVGQEEWEKVRSLFERLLSKTSHVKVWLSYANTESNIPTTDSNDRVRAIYKRANHALRSCEETEQRILLLRSWQQFELENGTQETKDRVAAIMPKEVTKRRKVMNEDGTTSRWEECTDFVFPEDQATKPTSLLLAKALQWKKKMESGEGNSHSENNEGEDNKEGKENEEENKEEESKEEELTEEEKDKRRIIQEMFDKDIDRDDSDVEIDSEDNKNDSSSSSSDSSSDSDDESDEEKRISKKERIRQKMEMFRAMREKRSKDEKSDE